MMDYFIDVDEILQTVQEKHIDFFNGSSTVIYDYLDIECDSQLILTLKRDLPKQILNDIYNSLELF
jgi:hypothetical protein